MGYEEVEVVHYFFGLWLFVFSRRFRVALRQRWRSRGRLGRAFSLLEMASSIFCGVVLPALILWLIFNA